MKITSLDGYSIEDLIKLEDTVDWESASMLTKRNITLVEARLFRSKIHWNLYFLTPRTLPLDVLECASKYFTPETYTRIAIWSSMPEEFIIKHRESVNWRLIIEYAYLSEETLLRCSEYWVNTPGIRESFTNARKIDINSGNYPSVELLLNLT